MVMEMEMEMVMVTMTVMAMVMVMVMVMVVVMVMVMVKLVETSYLTQELPASHQGIVDRHFQQKLLAKVTAG